MNISVVSEMWRSLGSYPVRGLFSAVVPDSSLARVRRVLLSEPTHIEGEDEDEDQENEKEDERDCEECKVETPHMEDEDDQEKRKMKEKMESKE